MALVLASALVLDWFRPMRRDDAIRVAVSAARSETLRWEPGRPDPSYRLISVGHHPPVYGGDGRYTVELLEDSGPYGYECIVRDFRLLTVYFVEYSFDNPADLDGNRSWRRIAHTSRASAPPRATSDGIPTSPASLAPPPHAKTPNDP